MSVGYGSRWEIVEGDSNVTPARSRISIRARSAGLNQTGTISGFQNVQINGSQVLNLGSFRSNNVSRYSISNGQFSLISSRQIDYHGGNTNQTDDINFINSIQDGELVVINTFDQPLNAFHTTKAQSQPFIDLVYNRLFSNKIRNILSTQNTNITSGTYYRCSYTIVGVVGKGMIFEDISPINGNVIETSLFLI